MSGISGIEIVFLFLLLFVVVFRLLARRIGIPYPIVMVVGRLLLSLVPGIPRATLNPDLIFKTWVQNRVQLAPGTPIVPKKRDAGQL
jgi:hypothetical protein